MDLENFRVVWGGTSGGVGQYRTMKTEWKRIGKEHEQLFLRIWGPEISDLGFRVFGFTKERVCGVGFVDLGFGV